MNCLKEVGKNLQKWGENIWKRASGNRGEKTQTKKRRKSQLRKENKVSFNRAEKGTWIYYFILAFDSYCSAIFLFWACRILFINPEVEEMMVERRRGSRTGETERRKKREEHAKVLCFGSVCRAARGLRAASFLTRLMMYGNVRYARWLLTHGRPFGGSAISFPRRVSGILGHGEESDSLNVRQVWHPTSRRQQLYVWRGGFFCGHSGEEMASTKQCLAVFGDDIKLGGREMEAGDWKIMANGGI